MPVLVPGALLPSSSPLSAGVHAAKLRVMAPASARVSHFFIFMRITAPFLLMDFVSAYDAGSFNAFGKETLGEYVNNQRRQDGQQAAGLEVGADFVRLCW